MDTGLNLVDVEDAAAGHLLAAERGVVGEKYILGGENLTLEQMLGRLAKLSGLSAPRIRVPYAVAWTFALGAEAVARTITRRAPRASLTEVRMARKVMLGHSVADGQRAGNFMLTGLSHPGQNECRRSRG